MRIARVIGKVTMNRTIAEIVPGSYLVIRTLNRGSLLGENEGNEETLVAYDNLGAREGDRIGLVEGAEATAPFLPKRVPFDCYSACILDRVDFDPVL